MEEWKPLQCGASVLNRDQFMFAIERMGLNLPPHMYEVGPACLLIVYQCTVTVCS